MTDAIYMQLVARLQSIEAQVGSMHTPPVEVTKADLRALRAEIESIRVSIVATQGEITARTAGMATRTAVTEKLNHVLETTVVPLLGDALGREVKERKQHIQDTLGSINAELTAVKNAASAQAQSSADFLRTRAAAFARG